MKLKVLTKIKDYEGKEIELGADGPITLRTIISSALNNNDPQEQITAEDKAKIYQLSTKIWNKKEVDLTLDDRTFIKDRAGKNLSAMIYGRLCDVLEDKKT